jgi:hypothetical protein
MILEAPWAVRTRVPRRADCAPLERPANLAAHNRHSAARSRLGPRGYEGGQGDLWRVNPRPPRRSCAMRPRAGSGRRGCCRGLRLRPRAVVRRRRRRLSRLPHCDSDGARAPSDRELARADVVPMHRTQRVRPSGASVGRGMR